MPNFRAKNNSRPDESTRPVFSHWWKKPLPTRSSTMTEMSTAEAVFFAAAALPPTERDAYLARACAGNDGLRRRVEQMLAVRPIVGDFLEPMPAEPGEGTSAHLPDSQAPTKEYGDPTARVGAILAGKYKLIEEIGEGGMGNVYMAQQTEPVKRAFAVKVIKAGMDSKAVLVRFEAERQALAMMDHPNIARVLDAGTTEGGRPFFVMELVKGTPNYPVLRRPQAHSPSAAGTVRARLFGHPARPSEGHHPPRHQAVERADRDV
jgi:hypothetical protein